MFTCDELTREERAEIHADLGYERAVDEALLDPRCPRCYRILPVAEAMVARRVYGCAICGDGPEERNG